MRLLLRRRVAEPKSLHALLRASQSARALRSAPIVALGVTDRRLSPEVKNGWSVRKNPKDSKDSRLVRLRARKDVERQNLNPDFGPR